MSARHELDRVFGTDRRLRARFEEVTANCPHNPEDAFVFAYDPAGLKPWKPNWVTKQFIAARKGAGLDHFRLHDPRHFMGTQMLGAGVSVPVVSARLAYARASTTLNVYAYVIPAGDVQAAQLISGIVNDPQWRTPTGNLSRRRARAGDRRAPELRPVGVSGAANGEPELNTLCGNYACWETASPTCSSAVGRGA